MEGSTGSLFRGIVKAGRSGSSLEIQWHRTKQEPEKFSVSCQLIRAFSRHSAAQVCASSSPATILELYGQAILYTAWCQEHNAIGSNRARTCGCQLRREIHEFCLITFINFRFRSGHFVQLDRPPSEAAGEHTMLVTWLTIPSMCILEASS
jgi:hypothetical protein